MRPSPGERLLIIEYAKKFDGVYTYEIYIYWMYIHT